MILDIIATLSKVEINKNYAYNRCMDKNKFKTLLKEADLNQVKFSELTGINAVTVSRWGKDSLYPIWIEDYLKGYKARTILKGLQQYIDSDK